MLNSHLQLTFHGHSSWSSPPLVGRDKERTTFTGDLLRDGARGSAAGLNRNGGKIGKEPSPGPKHRCGRGMEAVTVRLLSPSLL